MSSAEARLYIEDRKGNEIDIRQIPEEIQHEIVRVPMRLCPSCIGDTAALDGCKRANYRKMYSTSRVKGIDAFPSISATW
jgi:hypothetical protein